MGRVRDACWARCRRARETDLDRALDFACQMAGRDLTEREWEQLLPAQPYREVWPDL